MRYRHIIFDRDGCINQQLPNSKYITSIEDFKIFPDVTSFFNDLNSSFKSYLHFSVITNQQGISLGLYPMRAVEEMHNSFLTKIEMNLEKFPIYICPHLKNTCNCRKPAPTLIELAIERSKIDKNKTLFIGDSISDELSAKGAEIDFIYISRFKEIPGKPSIKDFNELKHLLEAPNDCL